MIDANERFNAAWTRLGDLLWLRFGITASPAATATTRFFVHQDPSVHPSEAWARLWQWRVAPVLVGWEPRRCQQGGRKAKRQAARRQGRHLGVDRTRPPSSRADAAAPRTPEQPRAWALSTACGPSCPAARMMGNPRRKPRKKSSPRPRKRAKRGEPIPAGKGLGGEKLPDLPTVPGEDSSLCDFTTTTETGTMDPRRRV